MPSVPNFIRGFIFWTVHILEQLRQFRAQTSVEGTSGVVWPLLPQWAMARKLLGWAIAPQVPQAEQLLEVQRQATLAFPRSISKQR